jgi:hypothetical protein
VTEGMQETALLAGQRFHFETVLISIASEALAHTTQLAQQPQALHALQHKPCNKRKATATAAAECKLTRLSV